MWLSLAMKLLVRHPLYRLFFAHGVGYYPKQYMTTSGVEFSVKEALLTSNASVDLFLHMAGGQPIANQRAKVMTYLFWANAQYIVCVFDVGSWQSFQNSVRWIQQVCDSDSTIPTEKLPLVGNKSDLRNESKEYRRAQVTKDEETNFTHENGLKYFECSAILGKDIDPIFHYIANDYFANQVRPRR
jgi:GTPase SAR1 family protein